MDIGKYLLGDCKAMEKIIFPIVTKIVGCNCFDKCISLGYVTLAGYTKYSMQNKFVGYISSIEIESPRNLVSIFLHTFSDYPKFTCLQGLSYRLTLILVI